MTELPFTPPTAVSDPATHHALAAAANTQATAAATEQLEAALAGSGIERILLKAAAGAGKSFALRGMVATVLDHWRCQRVCVAAFTNKQIELLAEGLGRELGRDKVCLYTSAGRLPDVPQSVRDAATVEPDHNNIPATAQVILATSHKLGFTLRHLANSLGVGANGGTVFDALFVDEAWQLAHHLYEPIQRAAPVVVGVGDVGQLPPLEIGENPWRGDAGYNPYRAWPTAFEDDPATWSIELPAVWRPTAEQLDLWRAFYPEWEELDCVAAPGDKSIDVSAVVGDSAPIWQQVATGVPTLVEVDGLDEPEAADIDPPLLEAVEGWLDELFAGGFSVRSTTYSATGEPTGETVQAHTEVGDDPLVSILSTRNQAVDDAHEMVERLMNRYDLPEGVIVASTVDSWQGQTNALTIAIHPLSGASTLDEFNSAFGRLAVTCTRATHGLLLVARAGLDDLLSTAAARPGTPLGEPGTRQLPRQTHKRILETFARCR